MYKSVIAGYSRSPFTMAKKGELIDIKPVNLLSEVIKNLVSKSKVNSKDIEDIVEKKKHENASNKITKNENLTIPISSIFFPNQINKKLLNKVAEA